MAKNSLSLSFVLMSRVAEVFKMWIWVACFPVSLSCGPGSRCFYIYVCLATSVQLYVKAAVRVVSWQTVLQCQFWLLFLTGLMRSSARITVLQCQFWLSFLTGLMRSSARTAGNCPVTALYTRSSCASCCLQTQL